MAHELPELFSKELNFTHNNNHAENQHDNSNECGPECLSFPKQIEDDSKLIDKTYRTYGGIGPDPVLALQLLDAVVKHAKNLRVDHVRRFNARFSSASGSTKTASSSLTASKAIKLLSKHDRGYSGTLFEYNKMAAAIFRDYKCLIMETRFFDFDKRWTDEIIGDFDTPFMFVLLTISEEMVKFTVEWKAKWKTIEATCRGDPYKKRNAVDDLEYDVICLDDILCAI